MRFDASSLLIGAVFYLIGFLAGRISRTPDRPDTGITPPGEAVRIICGHCDGTGWIGKYEACPWCDGMGSAATHRHAPRKP